MQDMDGRGGWYICTYCSYLSLLCRFEYCIVLDWIGLYYHIVLSYCIIIGMEASIWDWGGGGYRRVMISRHRKNAGSRSAYHTITYHTIPYIHTYRDRHKYSAFASGSSPVTERLLRWCVCVCVCVNGYTVTLHVLELVELVGPRFGFIVDGGDDDDDDDDDG